MKSENFVNFVLRFKIKISFSDCNRGASINNYGVALEHERIVHVLNRRHPRLARLLFYFCCSAKFANNFSSPFLPTTRKGGRRGWEILRKGGKSR